MSLLKERAAASWDETTPGAEPSHVAAAEPREPQQHEASLVPFIELTGPTSDDPPKITVFEAWGRVMRDVQGIGKHGLYNAAGTRYNFRGVDAMINAFGPACRRHGVIVIPTAVRSTHGDATTVGGKATRETIAVVSWRIYGPLGDFMSGESEGESLDSSDKGTAKAQSVALRAFLIAAGLVPTDEKDPDSVHIERGERPVPRAADYVAEICSEHTSAARLRTIFTETGRLGIIDHKIANEFGEDETLRQMLARIGATRKAGA